MKDELTMKTRKLFRVSIYCIIISSFYIVNLYPQIQGEIPWSTLADSPWPMMSHDPQATGRSPYVGPKTANVVWTMDMPYGIFSGPALGEEGTIYFGTNSWLSGETNYFYAAYPSGTLMWTFYTGETLATNAGFLVGSDSTVYFGSQGGFLYAVDLGGTLKWKYSVGSNIYQAVMNTDLEGNIYFSSTNGYLHSVDRNGELNWKTNLSNNLRAQSTVISPDGMTIYIAGRDSNFFALNLDGSIKWIYLTKEIRSVSLIDNEGNIYITPKGYPAEVHCIMPNGELNWKYSLTLYGSSGWWSGLTMDSMGNIYFKHSVPPNANSAITSIDYFGNFRWTYIFNDPLDSFTTPLICDADGTIYCGSSLGYYYYAISNEGELLWKLPLDGYQVDNSGAIGSDGTLYIGTHLSSTSTGQEKTLIAVRDSGATYVNDEVFLNKYILHQNYPNPFNPTTIISFSLAENSFVTMKVYDILGNEVRSIINDMVQEGIHQVEFDGSGLKSGVYFYEIRAGNFRDVKKLILLK
jgi:outer membrane protein assembly factor BamB